jgi:hypothetical protein
MKKLKFWWAWDSDIFGKWLEDMAAKGYILTKTSFASTLHEFEKTQPVKMSYCVDFHFKLASDYLTMVHEDGWKIIPSWPWWYILRKEYNGENPPKLYNDSISLLQRFIKLLVFLLSVFTLFIIAEIPIILKMVQFKINKQTIINPYAIILEIIVAIIVAFYLYLFWKFIQKVIQIKQQMKIQGR